MAFILNNFSFSRAETNTYAKSYVQSMHSYNTDKDTMENVLSENYFDPLLDLPISSLSDAQIIHGDLIYIYSPNEKLSNLFVIDELFPSIVLTPFVGQSTITSLSGGSHNNESGNIVLDKGWVGLDQVINTAQIPLGMIGVANGVAALDSSTKVPKINLPFVGQTLVNGMNVTASNATINLIFGTGNKDFRAVKAGRITGLSMSLTTQISTGFISLEIQKNGTTQNALNQYLLYNNTAPTNVLSLNMTTPITFVQNDLIGARLVTSGFTPIPNAVTVAIILDYN